MGKVNFIKLPSLSKQTNEVSNNNRAEKATAEVHSVSEESQLIKQLGHLLTKGLRSIKSTRRASYELGDINDSNKDGTLKRKNDSKKQRKLLSILPHEEPNESADGNSDQSEDATKSSAVHYRHTDIF